MRPQVIIDKVLPGAILLNLFLPTYNPAYAQCSIDENRQIMYKHDTSMFQYTEFIVSNKTPDTIYLWIDEDTVDDDSMSMEQKDICYFFKYIRAPKCELGLDFLCNDGSVRYDSSSTIIGCTFIKKILPDETFTIMSLDESVGKKSIHYVRKEIVSHFFRPERLDEFCYKKSYIIL